MPNQKSFGPQVFVICLLLLSATTQAQMSIDRLPPVVVRVEDTDDQQARMNGPEYKNNRFKRFMAPMQYQPRKRSRLSSPAYKNNRHRKTRKRKARFKRRS